VKIAFKLFAAVVILAGLFLWFRSDLSAKEQRRKADERRLEMEQSGQKVKHKLDCQNPEKRAQMTREQIDECTVGQ
jgi:hypothetical protein